MPRIFLADRKGMPADYLVVHLTADVPPKRTSFLKLKRQLSSKWPVGDIQLKRAPLHTNNPIETATTGMIVIPAGHEIHVHFSSAVRDSAALLTIGRIVKDWWFRNIRTPMKAARNRPS
jgi:hypothetical protein